MPQQADSLEFSRILAESRAIAEGAGQDWSSTHLLLALFVVPNPVALMLRAQNLSDDLFLRRLGEGQKEPKGSAAQLVERARQVARDTGSGGPKALHLMVALANARDGAAYSLLKSAGVKPAELSRQALSYAVGPLPRRFIPTEAIEEPPPPKRPDPQPRYAMVTRPPPSRRQSGVSALPSQLGSSKLGSSKLESSNRESSSPGLAHDAKVVEPSSLKSRQQEHARHTGFGVGKAGGSGVERASESSLYSRPHNPSTLSSPTRNSPSRNSPSRNSPSRLSPASPQQAQTQTPPAKSQPANARSAPSIAPSITPGAKPSNKTASSPDELARQARLSALKRIAQGADPSGEEEEEVLSPELQQEQAQALARKEAALRFELAIEEYPYLATLGRNLCQLAAEGGIDPVIGRDREIEEVLDILGKRRSNNPILVGDPGVGKTAVVEGVARRLVEDSRSGQVLIELDVAALVAGTHLRGSLSEKLTGIKDEVRRAAGRVVVFIDEIHTLIGAGATGDGPQDAAGELKAALARGEFPCIGATTWAELQKYFVQDPALERRFVPVRVDEPSIPDALSIVRGIAPNYERHHGVLYEDEALKAAVLLSARYINDRALPDKALAALDHAGSRARREGESQVKREHIARVIARMAGLPKERLMLSDAERILKLEEELSARVVGHRPVVQKVSAAVRRNFAGFSGKRPLASFIFLGPTGVGKTELARCLAEAVFGPDSLVRIDMSELSESHAVARLVGAPPGYVGFGEGGQLTEAVRRKPASVVLFDEFEKAHRDSQQILLQLLDEGHLSDSRGRKVDFASTIVVLTSNLGAEVFNQGASRSLGFGTGNSSSLSPSEKVLERARSSFPPELWNRIEERLVFEPLSREDLEQIARLLARDSSSRLFAEKQISFELSAEAIDFLLENGGYEPTLGARPMRQALSRLVEAPLAEQILRSRVSSGDRLQVVRRGESLDFEHLTVLDPTPAFAASAQPSGN